jgi:hypothetical protein
MIPEALTPEETWERAGRPLIDAVNELREKYIGRVRSAHDVGAGCSGRRQRPHPAMGRSTEYRNSPTRAGLSWTWSERGIRGGEESARLGSPLPAAGRGVYGSPSRPPSCRNTARRNRARPPSSRTPRRHLAVRAEAPARRSRPKPRASRGSDGATPCAQRGNAAALEPSILARRERRSASRSAGSANGGTRKLKRSIGGVRSSR